MAQLSRLRPLVLLAVLLTAATAQARPRSPVDPARIAEEQGYSRRAAAFLRGATRDARRSLCSDPGSRPALTALGRILERGTVPPELLMCAVTNIHGRPYLVNALRALSLVDHVAGVPEVVRRFGHGRDDEAARGPAFELVAGACLRGRLRGLGIMVKGNEVDGLLSDGTVVEMKDCRRNFISKVKQQLALRCNGRPAVLVLPREPDPYQIASLRQVSSTINAPFSVMVADPVTLTARTVLTTRPSSSSSIKH